MRFPIWCAANKNRPEIRGIPIRSACSFPEQTGWPREALMHCINPPEGTLVTYAEFFARISRVNTRGGLLLRRGDLEQFGLIALARQRRAHRGERAAVM